MTLDPEERERRGLPVREFLYTLDQVSFILNVGVRELDRHVVFEGVNGRRQPNPRKSAAKDDRMRAVRINPTELHCRPEWRIPEAEFVRYLKARKLVIYERRLR